jgi:hypothetical protein
MIKSSGAQYKTLKQGDDDFSFSSDGYTIVPRASIAISEKCPSEYQKILYECWGNGWLLPVAHMRDTEYTWEMLQK